MLIFGNFEIKDILIITLIIVVGTIIILSLLFLLFAISIKYDEFKKNKMIKNLNNYINLDELIKKTGFSNISYPIIFIYKRKNGKQYCSEGYFESINDYKNDILLSDFSEEKGKIDFIVDKNFEKYNVSFKKLSEYGINDEKLSNFSIPISNKTNENISFEEIENILNQPISELGYFSKKEFNEYKNKYLPKDIYTIIKILDNEM